MPKSDRLSRLLRMILTVQNHPGLTAEGLAQACGVGRRQCFRDLQTLCYAGIPIYNDNGYRLMEHFSLQQISFNLDEALSLLYGLKLIERQQAPFPTARVKERLLALLPKGLREGLEDLDTKVEAAGIPAADYTGKGELFHTLHEAIHGHEQVRMEYYSFSRDQVSERTVDPYHLVFKDGFWYLVAYCHNRDEARLFRVDRIRRLRAAGTHFVPPLDFTLESYLGSAWGMERGEEFTFRVRFWGEAARFVRETHFHPSQAVAADPHPPAAEPDSLVFAGRACGLKALTRWVLGFGAEAEVLTPKALRAAVAEEMRKGAERYE